MRWTPALSLFTAAACVTPGPQLCAEAHALAEAFAADFDARRVTALASRWAPEGDLVTIAGGYLGGRDAIERFVRRALEGPYRGGSLRLDPRVTRVLDTHAVLVRGVWKIEGAAAEAASSGLFELVLRRREDGWVIVAARLDVPRAGHTRDHAWPEACLDDRR